MNQIPEADTSNSQKIPGTWWDLLLYLLGGVGLFVLVSILIGHFFKEVTLLVTVLALLNNILFIGGSVYVLGIRRGKISWAELGLFPPVWRWQYLPIAAALALGMIPLRSCLGLIVQSLVEGGMDSLQARTDLIFAGGLTIPSFLVVLVGVGILAPIAEELFFRGLLYDWFRQNFGVPIAVGVSSLVFALAHIDSIGVVVSSLLIAVVIALAYERTRSLWVAIAMHVITNTTAVLLTYGMMLLSKVFDLPIM